MLNSTFQEMIDEFMYFLWLKCQALAPLTVFRYLRTLESFLVVKVQQWPSRFRAAKKLIGLNGKSECITWTRFNPKISQTHGLEIEA